jgi:hypothetical protein
VEAGAEADGRMSEELTMDPNMFPCGAHGERLSALEVTLRLTMKHGDERHAEISTKLDDITRLVRETNGQVDSLQLWRGEQSVKSEEFSKMATSVEGIRSVQQEGVGGRKTMLVIWSAAVVILGGSVSALVAFALRKVFG